MDVDAFFDGYKAMNADVAPVLLAQLNDPEFGRDIAMIFVTCSPADCAGKQGDVLERYVNFWIALEDEHVLGGRLATTIVRHEPGHGGHLHLRFKPKG
jgi:hypothetical protein